MARLFGVKCKINFMKRLDYIDALKGFTMFLVVWGHCIQILDNNDFMDNELFSIIYSFHMPLFFLISGCFFKSILKFSFINFIKKKTLQFILPSITWMFFYYSWEMYNGVFNYNILHFEHYLNSSSWPFWFLIELFKTYVLLFLLYRIFKNQIIIFLSAIIFVFLIPGQDMDLQRFLLPFFLLGILITDYDVFIDKYIKLLIVGSLFVFLVCLYFWKVKYTIYFTTFPAVYDFHKQTFIFKNYLVAALRFTVGLSGSILFLCIFKYFETKKYKLLLQNWLVKIGKETLGIYILQKLIFAIFLKDDIDFLYYNKWLSSLITMPLISIVIINLLLFLIRYINSNKIASLFLIGKS